MNPIPPRALLFAAALFIIFGASEVISTFTSFLLWDNFSLHLGFIGIPIGSGLLVGRESSRIWAIRLCVFGLLVLIAGAIWASYSGWFRTLTKEQLWEVGASSVMCAIVLGTLVPGLRSAKIREWFKSQEDTQHGRSSWVMPLVMVGMLYAIGSELRSYGAQVAIDEAFPVRTQFTFRNSGTGEPVDPIEWSSDAIRASNDRRDLRDPRLSTWQKSGPSGLTLDVNGIIWRPVKLSFTSDGFQARVYILDKKTPRDVTISLDPIK